MKLAIVYIMPLCAGERYFDYALRFLASYHANPPGLDHETVIVLNGGQCNSEITCLFSTLPNVRFIEHDNSGYDIGGFQCAARSVPCGLMLFLGVSTYFKGSGWLARVLDSYAKHGPALYGVMGNRGDKNANVYPHIRTTGFWLPPQLMNAYPLRVTSNAQRYQFEHGENCLAEWIRKAGMKRLVVTWDAEYEWIQWDLIPNGFHQGNQSAMLMGDHISEPPFYHTA